MFYNCYTLTELILHWYTPSLKDTSRMFYGCTKLETLDIGTWNGSNITNLTYMFQNCTNLINLTFMQNLGAAWQNYSTANNVDQTIDLSSSKNLTYESLMSVINNIYDIASINCATQKLVLGTTNKAKLEATEEGQQAIENATLKGWSVS